MDVPDVSSAGLSARPLGDDDVAELLAFMTECRAFFELVEGHGPTAASAAELIVDRPEGLSPDRKALVGLRRHQRLVGLLEVLKRFPDDQTWYLGLLLLSPAQRSVGTGRSVYSAAREWARRDGAKRFKLIVQEQNPAALRFWQANGFRETGRTTQHLGEHANVVIRMAHDWD